MDFFLTDMLERPDKVLSASFFYKESLMYFHTFQGNRIFVVEKSHFQMRLRTCLLTWYFLVQFLYFMYQFKK